MNLIMNFFLVSIYFYINENKMIGNKKNYFFFFLISYYGCVKESNVYLCFLGVNICWSYLYVIKYIFEVGIFIIQKQIVRLIKS